HTTGGGTGSGGTGSGGTGRGGTGSGGTDSDSAGGGPGRAVVGCGAHPLSIWPGDPLGSIPQRCELND
ncbi:MAG: hypothetical protein QOI50_971, partial [Pseudonocardiales bacterium]|nr:hypothetical protein [Pseudonocardiales bacterium]